jgi:hypothetical protein
MTDHLTPGAIIRMEFQFRPKVKFCKRRGEKVVIPNPDYGKPRNGLLVEWSDKHMLILPITHSGPDRHKLLLPTHTQRRTEKLDTDAPSYIACNELNLIEPGHPAIIAAASGRSGDRKVYGRADRGTLSKAMGMLQTVLREDIRHKNAHAAELLTASENQKEVFNAEKPLWMFTHKDHGSSYIRELTYQTGSNRNASPAAKPASRAEIVRNAAARYNEETNAVSTQNVNETPRKTSSARRTHQR